MTTTDQRPIVLDTNVISELTRPEPDEAVVTELKRVIDRTYITTENHAASITMLKRQGVTVSVNDAYIAAITVPTKPCSTHGTSRNSRPTRISRWSAPGQWGRGVNFVPSPTVPVRHHPSVPWSRIQQRSTARGKDTSCLA